MEGLDPSFMVQSVEKNCLGSKIKASPRILENEGHLIILRKKGTRGVET